MSPHSVLIDQRKYDGLDVIYQVFSMDYTVFMSKKYEIKAEIFSPCIGVCVKYRKTIKKGCDH